MLNSLKDNNGLTCTINTTEDCNLRCKYCYEINKCNKTIKLEDAKKFIDLILEDPDPAGILNDKDRTTCLDNLYNGNLIIDFIGGDSFMNIDILEDICEYVIKKTMTSSNENVKRWRGNTIFSISTNGTLFNDRVKAFCEKYKRVLQVGVSIDGCPEIHDKYRVFKDGVTGSMPEILKNWGWYQKTFPYLSEQTKATASKATIPYLYDSLVFMHEQLGLNYINQNFIMEDTGCTEEDYKILDEQLGKCVDYVLEHRNELYWSMLEKENFAYAHHSNGADWLNSGQCGSGAMPALSIDGDIYACFRWLPHTQKNNPKLMSVGNIENGLNHKENFQKIRHGAYRDNCTKDEKCRNCSIESACSYCIGGCYAEFGDFIRTTYICEITKLQVKWSRIYWDRYNELEGLPKIDWEAEGAKRVMFRKIGEE